MPAVVVVGAQWGDEGKGKVVDLLAPYADLVVRYAGGANAGHTLVVAGEKVVLHLVPSGILHAGQRCLVGQGTVIDADTLLAEVEALRAGGVEVDGRLFLADRAHVVLPHHKAFDGIREDRRARAGRNVIGTTKRGIGPAYEDKVGRRGIRVGDLMRDDLRARVAMNLEGWRPLAEMTGTPLPDEATLCDRLESLGERLAPFIADGARMACDALNDGQKVLLEGAQGTMLDIDHGTYPFVTSSNAVSGGACTGAGIGPTHVRAVIGITKAYTTRVGGGPFPTELDDAPGEALRQAGAEFGATTGRPRRTGWLDIPALRHAARVNGLTSIALTKLDVLRGVDPLRMGTAYRCRGELLDAPPFDPLGDVTPEYESMPGFDADLTTCRERSALPDAAKRYIDRIAELVGVPVDLISVGADREETIGLSDPFTV